MSLTVTSFCRSIQARPLPPCTYHKGLIDTGASSALGKLTVALERPNPSSACRAMASPVTKAPWVDRTPPAAPATNRLAIPSKPGTKAAISARQTGLERWCEVIFRLGFQPPETPRALVLITSVWPSALRTVIWRRPSRPSLSTTSAPRKCRMPGSRAPPARLSMTATTSTPLDCRSTALRNPSSLLVKTATRSPTATPQRLA